jgi:hypothetical protein
MAKLLQAFRRNPDALALAVLCVVLGVGRQAVAARPVSAFSNNTLGIQWGCVKPATDALDTLRDKLRHLTCAAPEAFHLPDFQH